MLGKLASLFIEFSVEGANTVKDALADVRGQLKEASDSADEIGRAMSAAFAEAGRAAGEGMAEVVRSMGGGPAEARKAAEAMENAFDGIGSAVAKGLRDSTAGISSGAGVAARSMGMLAGEAGTAAGAVGTAFGGIGAALAREFREAGRATRDGMAEMSNGLGLSGEKAKQVSTMMQRVLRDAIGTLPRETNKGTEATKGHLARLGDTFSKIGTQVQEMGRATGTAFAMASGTLLGFVRAGVNSSGLGDVLGYQFQELSRQIAAVFLPEIEAVINALQRTINWFRNLSGEQQDQIASWAKWGLVVLGVGPILTRVIGLAMGAATAFRAVGAALTIAFTSHPILAVVAAVAAAVLSVTDLKEVFAGVAEALGSFASDMKDLFGGISEIIREIAKETSSWLDSLRDGIRSMAGATGEKKGMAGSAASSLNVWGNVKDVWAGMGVDRDSWANTGLSMLSSPLLAGPATLGKFADSWLGLGLFPKRNQAAAAGEGGSSSTDAAGSRKGRRDLLPKVGAFMDLDSAYKQIAQTTMKATAGMKPVDEKQLETLNAINAALDAMWKHIQRLRPLTV